MTFPNSPDKYSLPGVLTPADLISHRGKDGKKELRGGVSAILCFESVAYRYLSRQFGGKKAGGFTGDVAPLKRTGYRIAAARSRGFGAPSAAVMLEELAASGITRCIAIGVAGTLQDSIVPGDLIIPTGALRDEGTSYHYLPSNVPATPNEELSLMLMTVLSGKGARYKSGKVWTTDAPYRETVEEIIRHRDEGLLAVDMETSAFLSVASALKIQAACALVAADSLARGTWHPPADIGIVNSSLRQLADAAVEALAP